jgi:NAD(P)H-hydrate epimerase
VIPVLRAAAMRAADAGAIRAGVPSAVLMENAGTALVGVLRRRYPGWRRVVVVCGPGNNGGDGLVAARQLAFAGVGVDAFTLGNPSAYRGDAAENLARARAAGVAPETLGGMDARRRLVRALAAADGVVDALFGTGLTRPLSGEARRVVAAMNASGRAIVAADVPSGVSSDSGEMRGPAVRAAMTVAFGAAKPCHLLPPASGACGRLVVADIGIPRAKLEAGSVRLWLTEASDVAARLAPRPVESHKADFGRLAVIAGSRGKAGAALLAARGALRAGAGLVTIFCAESLAPLLVSALPEAMTEPLPEARGAIAESAAGNVLGALGGFDAAVVGPGLGTAEGTVRFLQGLLAGTRIPLVLDADALNAFAGRPEKLRRPGPVRTVLTPHPGEAGRLLGQASRRIQADRPGAASRIARRAGSVVVLKGPRTLVAEPGGRISANPTGTPLLATAGSGDVLAGILGAFLAGGLSPRDAAMCGAWLHGAAAEALEPELGDAGLLAHEIADTVPGVRRRLLAAGASSADADV